MTDGISGGTFTGSAWKFLGGGLALTVIVAGMLWTTSGVVALTCASLLLCGTAVSAALAGQGRTRFAAGVLFGAFAITSSCGGISAFIVVVVDRALHPLPHPELTPFAAADYHYLRHPTLGWVIPSPTEGWLPTDGDGELGPALRLRDTIDGVWTWSDPDTNARFHVISTAAPDANTASFDQGYLFGVVRSLLHDARDHDDELRAVTEETPPEVWFDLEGPVHDGVLAATMRSLRFSDASDPTVVHTLTLIAFHHPDDDLDVMLSMAHLAGTPWVGPGVVLTGFEAPETTLERARETHPSTLVVHPEPPGAPSPAQPPFSFTSFSTSVGTMPAYIALPLDGEQRGAVLWLHGGFSVGDEIAPDWGPAALAARGIAVLVPALRGEPGSPGHRELMWGEVDDARDALAHLSSLAHVAEQDIVVIGHSTGATLALLLAERGTTARAFVCFGPVAEAFDLTYEVPAPFPPRHPEEVWVRSPIHFLAGIEQPTYVFEGTEGNAIDLDLFARLAPDHGPLRARLIEGDHFSIVVPLVVELAERIDDEGPLF